METFDRKKHWENIYSTKELKEVSWYQPIPEISLDFVKQLNVPLHAAIIDVGGGDSFLVDHLLDAGYKNITVLDISKTAIDKAKQRLGDKASEVTWIVSDITEFEPSMSYDFWHDRAAFHFLTDDNEVSHYLETARKAINENGVIVVGTFSENGPKKCSGIEIKQYSESGLSEKLTRFFNKIRCISTEHKTPFETIQHFIFCSFRKPQVV